MKTTWRIDRESRLAGWPMYVGTAALPVAGVGVGLNEAWLVGVALLMLALAHMTLMRLTANIVLTLQRDYVLHQPDTATIAKWMQTLGRRTGQLDARSWVCRSCLQANVGWDEECGRCGMQNVDGVLTREVART